MNQHLEQIDADIAEKHLLKHPFYQAWVRGELTEEALKDYAQQYYHHVAAFPTYLSAVHAKCDDQPTRRQILSNLIDEEAGSPNHPELWKQFAGALGADTVGTVPQQPETKHLIGTLQKICGGESTAEGLAALYAYESQIPSICESKIDGLKKHYGFSNPKDYEYFSVHIEADKEHSATERKLLDRYIDDANIKDVRESVRGVLDALWDLLSGVCHRHAIAC